MSIVYDSAAKTVTIDLATETVKDVIAAIAAVDPANAETDGNCAWILDIEITIAAAGTLKIDADFVWAMRGSTHFNWQGHLYLDKRSVTRLETSTSYIETVTTMAATASFTAVRHDSNGLNPQIVYANSQRHDFPTISKNNHPALINVTGLDLIHLTSSATSYFKLYFGNADTVTAAENIRFFTVAGNSAPQYFNTIYDDFRVDTLKIVSESTVNTVIFNDPVFELSSDQDFNGDMRVTVWYINNPKYPGVGKWTGVFNKKDVRTGSKFYYQFGSNLTIKAGLITLQNVQIEWTRADVGVPFFTEPNTSYNALTDGNGQASQLLADAYTEELTNDVDRYTWTCKARDYDHRSFGQALFSGRVLSDTGEVTEDFQLEDISATLGGIAEATAAAYTGIAIVGGSTKTLTVTSSAHQVVNIWAYYRYWISLLANFATVDEITSDGTDLTLGTWTYKNPNMVTGTIIGGTVEWDTPGAYSGKFKSNTFDLVSIGTYDFRGSDFAGDALVLDSSNNSTVTVQLTPGTPFTNNNPTYITVETSTGITISNANLVDGTRVRLYNVTQVAEIDNSVVSGGSGYSYSVTVGVGEAVEVGDTIRMTSAYCSGTTYYNETDESAVAGLENISMLASQSANTILNGYGIDGSTQTDFTADYPNVEIDINSGDTTRQQLLCWLAHITTTAEGIREFFGAVIHEDAGNAKIITAVVDLRIDYTGAGNSRFTDDMRLYRDDGTSIFGGAGDNFYAESGKIYVAETGVSGLTGQESAQLMAIPTNTAPANEYDSELAAIKADTGLISAIENGRWLIQNNQQIFYAADNITEIARFNLFDAAGNPTETSVYERVRV